MLRRVYLPALAEISGVRGAQPAVEKVEQMWRLWGEQEHATLGTPEHMVLIEHIRLLLVSMTP